MTNFERWKFYLKDIESPDSYIEWGYYHLISSALQRNVWMFGNKLNDLPSAASLFPNQFTVLIGPPATGKGRVLKQEIGLMNDGKLRVADNSGHLKPLIHMSPDKVTCEKLIDIIAECSSSREFTVVKPDGPKKRVNAHSSLTSVIEELEVLFQKNANDMINLLLQLFDCGDLSYQTRHQAKHTIKNVCMSFIAGTTPQALKSLMDMKIVGTGLTSRIIFVYADKPRFQRIFPGITAEQQTAFDELVAHTKLIASKTVGEVTFSPEANEYYRSIYEALDGEESKMQKGRVNRDMRLDYYYGRKNIHWLKLCMIGHFADQHDNYVIQQPTVEWAYKRLSEVEVNMHRAFSVTTSNVIQEICPQIVRYLKETGDVPHKRVWFNFPMERKDFDSCIEYLITTEQVKSNSGILGIVRKET